MSNNKHPWDKWFARKRKFKLKRSRDYEGMTHAMSITIRRAAARRGVGISIRVLEGDALEVTMP